MFLLQVPVSCPYSSSLSETLDRLFPYSSTLWDTFMLYNVAYPQIRMLIILALQLCPYHHHHHCHHPPLPCTPPALACSSMQRAIKTQGGLVLCGEQSGCQRPRGPCPWAQQQPRSAVLLFAGAPRHHARASLRSALSQGALWICDRLWVGEFILMLKRQRTQTDNPRLKQSCSNFPPLNKGTYVQTVKFNSIIYAVCSACFSAKDFPTVNRKLQLQPENA